MKTAYRAAKDGEIVGTMFFSSNFSKALKLRQEDIISTSEQIISDGQIQVALDMSSTYLSLGHFL